MKAKAIGFVVLLAILAVVGYFKHRVYNECRADHHSKMYCAQLISK